MEGKLLALNYTQRVMNASTDYEPSHIMSFEIAGQEKHREMEEQSQGLRRIMRRDEEYDGGRTGYHGKGRG